MSALVARTSRSSAALFAASTTLLFCGFFWNAWRVADGEWFAGFKRDSESHILGRMAKSRRDGVFSAGGLTGLVARCSGSPPTARHAPDDWVCRDRVWPVSGGALHLRARSGEWPSPKLAEFQYLAYSQDLRFNTYSVYMSQVGGQGMAFGLIDRWLPLPPGTRYRSYRIVTALLTAIALALVVRWFHAELGICAALCALASGLLSQWLTAFARNLWWSTWAFFLPLVVMMLFLERARRDAVGFHAKLAAVAFAAVLAKCLVNGYEFVSAVLVMTVVPLLFHSVRRKIGLRAGLGGLLAAASGAALAILVSLVVLCLQIGSLGGGWSSGIEEIRSALVSRTHPEAARSLVGLREVPETGTLEVISDYLGGSFLGFGARQATSTTAIARRALEIPYALLVGVFVVASGMLERRRRGLAEEERRRDLALQVALWFSLLAPLSWFVVFKAHAGAHLHLDFVVWQMPFTLYGFAACGRAFERQVLEPRRRRAGLSPAGAREA